MKLDKAWLIEQRGQYVFAVFHDDTDPRDLEDCTMYSEEDWDNLLLAHSNGDICYFGVAVYVNGQERDSLWGIDSSSAEKALDYYISSYALPEAQDAYCIKA